MGGGFGPCKVGQPDESRDRRVDPEGVDSPQNRRPRVNRSQLCGVEAQCRTPPLPQHHTS